MWLTLPVLLWTRLGSNGYNTTDYGFIVGQSWRLLHGEVPHRDFISARPAGSAYLHLVDFALPLPLVDSSRLVALVIIVLIGLASGIAVLGKLPTRWSVTGHVVALTAVLFTLNTFQVGPWYTADGMLFALASVAALRLWDRRTTVALPVVALLSAGVAPLMKQSFFLAVPLAVGWVLVRLYRNGALSWLRAVRVTLLAGLPGLLYVAAAAATGALVPMVSQLTSATRPNWTGTLLSLSTVASASGALVILLVVSGLLCLVWLRRAGVSKNGGNAAATAAAVGYLGAVALGLTAHFDMYDSGWSTRLFWGACAATVVAGLALGRLRTGDLGVVAVAWMTVLSWGMPWPLLSSGGLLLVIAQALARPTGDVFRRGTARGVVGKVWLVAALVGLLITGVGLDDAIQHRVVHRDLPATMLHTPLKPLDRDFGRARTNPSTAALLADALACRRDHPASGVVFGSWNSDLYAILGIRNPLATDGANNYEITGAEDQYRDSVTRLGARGDYLVLFPLVNPELVHTLDVTSCLVPRRHRRYPSTGSPRPVPYSWMSEQLPGTRVACGVWVGIYQPRTS